MWFQLEIFQNMRKIGPAPIAGGHPKCDEFIIKMGTVEMRFHFNQADMWFSSQIRTFDSFVLTTFWLSSSYV